MTIEENHSISRRVTPFQRYGDAWLSCCCAGFADALRGCSSGRCSTCVRSTVVVLPTYHGMHQLAGAGLSGGRTGRTRTGVGNSPLRRRSKRCVHRLVFVRGNVTRDVHTRFCVDLVYCKNSAGFSLCVCPSLAFQTNILVKCGDRWPLPVSSPFLLFERETRSRFRKGWQRVSSWSLMNSRPWWSIARDARTYPHPRLEQHHSWPDGLESTYLRLRAGGMEAAIGCWVWTGSLQVPARLWPGAS